VKKRYARELAQIGAIVADTGAFFARHGIDPALRLNVDLAVEELFVNLVTYNTETRAHITIEMRPLNDGIEVALTDRGVERFDPTVAHPVDIEALLEERAPGGLGLYLVAKMVDTIHYEYRDRTSKITFTKRGGTGEEGRMFEIRFNEGGDVVVSGRLDAVQAPTALSFFDRVEGSCVVDMGALEYISSAGLGVLLRTHKRLMANGQGLQLVNVNAHIGDIFTYSGFDRLFVIRTA
jgi:anti-anti-sigma factor